MTDVQYSGGCHCAALGFHYWTSIGPADWSVRACQCRFCRMHNALSTSDPAGRLQFFADDPTRVVRYRFAMHTTDFLLCSRCGGYIGAVIETDSGSYGIINTRTLAAIPQDIADDVAVSYEKEDSSGRVSRRESRWTPVSGLPWA